VLGGLLTGGSSLGSFLGSTLGQGAQISQQTGAGAGQSLLGALIPGLVGQLFNTQAGNLTGWGNQQQWEQQAMQGNYQAAQNLFNQFGQGDSDYSRAVSSLYNAYGGGQNSNRVGQAFGGELNPIQAAGLFGNRPGVGARGEFGDWRDGNAGVQQIQSQFGNNNPVASNLAQGLGNIGQVLGPILAQGLLGSVMGNLGQSNSNSGDNNSNTSSGQQSTDLPRVRIRS
jgi:hypothetical protein